MNKQERFNAEASSWVKMKDLPWAKMRYEISHHFLMETITEKPLKILNVGCGDGIESLLLDDLKAEHLLVDYSEEMINQAEQFLSHAGFNSPYKAIVSNVYELESKITGKYDLILFHNVLEYIDDPKQAIAILKSLLSDKGILSIRHLNRYTNMVAPALFQNNLDIVEKYLKTPEFDSSFDITMMTYTGEEVEEFITQNGLDCLHRYGVMSLNNYIVNNEIKYEPDFYNKQKELEIYMADKFPYYHMARFGLFYCKKK
ncbi:methyltransferase domain-containing protein [Spirochaeta cellobiosiphila]|uniref:methyltransferase domain-containing protein n=1 Tax=Spirochaeta cellobiosiphila TaxID=504483 RepID=UPI000410AF85|nr:methyltransferase domain-containing protein [Spirochaeta cellobiosiphila]